MTTERQHGKFVFHCDEPHCHEFIETDSSDFFTALNYAKECGWKPIKDEDSGEWEHKCPECAES